MRDAFCAVDPEIGSVLAPNGITSTKKKQSMNKFHIESSMFATDIKTYASEQPRDELFSFYLLFDVDVSVQYLALAFLPRAYLHLTSIHM